LQKPQKIRFCTHDKEQPQSVEEADFLPITDRPIGKTRDFDRWIGESVDR
jgi:ribosome maturation factor RimP